MHVLLYHQINKLTRAQDPFHLSVTPSKFYEQMAYLYENKYRCISLTRAVRDFKMNKKLPPHAFSITFDDGYQDNYDNAFPILKKFGFTATIFIVSDLVGKFTSWDGLTSTQRFSLMNWSSIREMTSAGMDFGSHSCTHARMTTLEISKIRKELVSSKEKIESETGTKVELFAFPYEASNNYLTEQVKLSGYLGACGSVLLKENPFNIWRTECYGRDTMMTFRLKTSMFWRMLIKLKYHTVIGKDVRAAFGVVKKYSRGR